MLYQKPEDELKALRKRQIVLEIIETPGAILVGLALYGKFGENELAFLDFLTFLDNNNVTTAMLTVGAVIMGWCFLQVISSNRRRRELQRALDT